MGEAQQASAHIEVLKNTFKPTDGADFTPLPSPLSGPRSTSLAHQQPGALLRPRLRHGAHGPRGQRRAGGARQPVAQWLLHRAIREQGGAYGGGASQDSNSGAFRFYSYRDPRLEETLADFDKAIDWFMHSQHSWQSIEESILGAVSGIDKPDSPLAAPNVSSTPTYMAAR